MPPAGPADRSKRNPPRNPPPRQAGRFHRTADKAQRNRPVKCGPRRTPASHAAPTGYGSVRHGRTEPDTPQPRPPPAIARCRPGPRGPQPPAGKITRQPHIRSDNLTTEPSETPAAQRAARSAASGGGGLQTALRTARVLRRPRPATTPQTIRNGMAPTHQLQLTLRLRVARPVGRSIRRPANETCRALTDAAQSIPPPAARSAPLISPSRPPVRASAPGRQPGAPSAHGPHRIRWG